MRNDEEEKRKSDYCQISNDCWTNFGPDLDIEWRCARGYGRLNLGTQTTQEGVHSILDQTKFFDDRLKTVWRCGIPFGHLFLPSVRVP